MNVAPQKQYLAKDTEINIIHKISARNYSCDSLQLEIENRLTLS